MLTWTVHPARESPAKTLLAAGFVLGLAVAVGMSVGSVLGGVVALAFLLGSLREYFLPTRYSLDTTGVDVRRLGWTRRRPWSDFRRHEAGPRAVLLSPLSRPSRLDTYRGTVLLLTPEVREAVLAQLAAHVTAEETDA